MGNQQTWVKAYLARPTEEQKEATLRDLDDFLTQRLFHGKMSEELPNFTTRVIFLRGAIEHFALNVNSAMRLKHLGFDYDQQQVFNKKHQ